ncbi:hypothetical protein SGRA_0751 [Saprospira grandis str. Lewin]|uniref:Uncharacterized protein n=1 Tax=Saprospira grandis (strain Lewin) TaxID=984262 RepID=H6L1E9_SAPGL|nr:hypothetical protein SGRA_0751 [Saprospira grandis str. Lewin]
MGFFVFGASRSKLRALRFGARKSARPCGGFAAWVWPDGHPAASLGRLAFGHGCGLKPAANFGTTKLDFGYPFLRLGTSP